MRTKTKPDKIGDLIVGYRAAKILFTAVRLDLFSRIDPRGETADSIARGARLDASATRIFLDSLYTLGYLEKAGPRYKNSELTRKLLVRGSPTYVGDNLKYQDQLWDAWSDLGGVLESGRPKNRLEKLLNRPDFSRDYIRGMDNISRRPAEELASRLRCVSRARLLDVGAGPGRYSIALLKRNPDMRASLLDLPSTLTHTRALLTKQPASIRRRVRLVPANYRTADFGQENADIVLLSHVTHDEGVEDNKKLLAKSHRALRPKGLVVIHDFISRTEGPTPLFTTLFSMHMRVYTTAGQVYNEETYAGWLRQAGFRVLAPFNIAKNSLTQTRAVIGRKP